MLCEFLKSYPHKLFSLPYVVQTKKQSISIQHSPQGSKLGGKGILHKHETTLLEIKRHVAICEFLKSYPHNLFLLPYVVHTDKKKSNLKLEQGQSHQTNKKF